MHSIQKIKITNFRSCRNTEFDLSLFTPIVGYNNSGKSNVLSALKWFCNPYSLSKKDFFALDEPIVIHGEIIGVTPELLNNIDPKHRIKIQPYSSNTKIGIRRTQNHPDCKVADIKLEIRDYNVIDESAEGAWKVNPTGIAAAIKALFPEPLEIRAMEDAAEDVGKNKATSSIGRLINALIDPIEIQHEEGFNTTISRIRNIFEINGTERAKELKEIDDEVTLKLQDIFPGISIGIHIPTPTLRELFKNGTIRVFEQGSNEYRDVMSFGHGTQRSIQMALVRHLADVKARQTEWKTCTLLLVDEPELYLHPQAIEQVRYSLKVLASHGYQVIFTSHSPQMIHLDDVSNTLMIYKDNDSCTSFRKSIAQSVEEVVRDHASQAKLLFDFGNSNQILFSHFVLLTEGKTEQRIIPHLYNCIQGRTLGMDKMALIGVGGAESIPLAMKILFAIGIDAKGLVDLDFAFTGAIKHNLINEDNVDIVVCKKYFQELATEKNTKLSNNGLPNKNTKRAGVTFSSLLENDDAKKAIENLHDHLKKYNLWLWKKGDIESVLDSNLKKGESAWDNFVAKIMSDGIENVVDDKESVTEFINWLKEPFSTMDLLPI